MTSTQVGALNTTLSTLTTTQIGYLNMNTAAEQALTTTQLTALAASAAANYHALAIGNLSTTQVAALTTTLAKL